MALKFETSKSANDALAQLMQLAEFSQQRKDRKQRRYASMQEELGEGIEGIYDNSVLGQRRVHFDRYYADNKGDMDEDTLARFDMMKQKYDLQEQANNDFKQGMDYAKNIGGQVEDSLIDYSNVQGYNEAQINTLWNELNPDSKVEKTIEEKRTDLRANRMDSVKELTDAYSGFSGEFRASHGQRLGTAGFRQDAAYVQNLNEMFTFGIIQAEDDYLLDSKESQALRLGINQGSYQPIQDYKTNEAARNREIQGTETKDLNQNYKLAAEYQKIINKSNAFDDLSEIGKANLRDDNWATIGEEEITYGMLEEDPDIIDSIEQSKSEAIQNVKNIDSSYSKREGISWLQDNNTDKNIDFQFKESESPIKIPEIKTEDKKEVIDKPKGSAIITKEDEDWFTVERDYGGLKSKSWYPVEGRKGKGWAAEATVKEEKLDKFMSMAFEPDNFENGKLKENSQIYKIIQRAKKNGSRRMKKLEDKLKQYAQAIKNIKTGQVVDETPSYINKLTDDVKWLLTTKERFEN